MRRAARNPLLWVVLTLLSVVFVGPIAAMLLTSLKPTAEAQSADPGLLPGEITFRAYEVLFTSADNPVLRWFLNSMLAATAHALLVVLTASLAGYALARMDFPGKNLMFGVIISTMFVPGFIFLMPNFLTLDRLGWLDTLAAIVVPGAAGAFGVFFMRQFFLSLPKEFEESARIDGAGPFTTFFRIMLPNATPALVTLLVLSFLANWNDFIWPLYVLFNDARLTLPIGLSKLQGAYTIDYPVIMAGAVIASLPVLLLYVFVQRYVIDGVATSGVKG
ncbi:carbohydrate ABC transporter permease [uncultured Serinicoccus sp.]|uniref:carbohydrate ABC transporter permease n=2 Tax=uncultured Serinicoccus sp. TaxID=735514 RepID=UPI002623731B|nr:carbohydrate ABC transporter permease [uncultured Serinicoccus sp.]